MHVSILDVYEHIHDVYEHSHVLSIWCPVELCLEMLVKNWKSSWRLPWISKGQWIERPLNRPCGHFIFQGPLVLPRLWSTYYLSGATSTKHNVYIYIYIYVYVYIYIYIYTYTHTCVYIYSQYTNAINRRRGENRSERGDPQESRTPEDLGRETPRTEVSSIRRQQKNNYNKYDNTQNRTN